MLPLNYYFNSKVILRKPLIKDFSSFSESTTASPFRADDIFS